ncbi:formimidoylglutamase [Flavobacteriales bacterium]|nr:formimidoylglutamase [Flavobacteriales bacterium]
MEFELSFKPIVHQSEDYQASHIGTHIMAYTQGDFPNLSEADLVIFSVPEFRGAQDDNDAHSLNSIRKELYMLHEGQERLRIADLGQLILGESKADTYQLLTDVLVECEHRGLFTLIIGGSQDLTIAQYRSCVELGKLSNMVSIDSTFDISVDEHLKSSHSFFSDILKIEPNVLFNYTNIGYQTYLNNQDSIKLIDKLYFDAYRLGEIRQNIEEVEPSLRNADLVSFDLGSVRLSDNPSTIEGSPNGFYAEEACQIMRYAGISGRLKSLGIYNYMNVDDKKLQSEKLIAQMIWCFFEGFFHKMKQFKPTDDDMVKYHVSMRKGEYNACFYKNKKLEKWWMEIPIINPNPLMPVENYFIPCSYADYQIAVEGDMPQRWWKAFQKMNQH